MCLVFLPRKNKQASAISSTKVNSLFEEPLPQNTNFLTLFKFALQQGQLSTVGYDLVGAMGPGVVAYWSSAVLNEFPIPIIPPPGTVGNIGVYYNMVMTPGIWKPAFLIPPTTITQTLVDIFIF